MNSLSLTDAKLKEIFKAALLEIFAEQKDVLTDLIVEALEDIGLAKAIEEGKDTEIVSRKAIFEILDGNHEG